MRPRRTPRRRSNRRARSGRHGAPPIGGALSLRPSRQIAASETRPTTNAATTAPASSVGVKAGVSNGGGVGGDVRGSVRVMAHLRRQRRLVAICRRACAARGETRANTVTRHHDVETPGARTIAASVSHEGFPMDVQTLLVTVVVLFTIAALGGVAMAAIRLGSGKSPPAWLAMLHGMLGAAGLTLLAFAMFTTSLPSTAMIGGVLILLAALGGAYMNLAFHWHGRLLPKGLLFGHALLAVAGYLCLILSL